MDKKVIKELKSTIQKEKGFSITRIQKGNVFSLRISEGKVLGKNSVEAKGAGFHYFSPSGGVGFASCDRLDPNILHTTYFSAKSLADNTPKSFHIALDFLDGLPVYQSKKSIRLPKQSKFIDYNELEKKVLKLSAQMEKLYSDCRFQTSFVIAENHWRILRSDGTDVAFNIPRSILVAVLTLQKNNDQIQLSTNMTGLSSEILLDPNNLAYFKQKIKSKVMLARELIDKPMISAGSYPLIIDYSLAKGLAHEAFGHAAESDAAKNSILYENGKLKKGLQVAPPFVDIIDESIRGDNAYQPFDANGFPRQRVYIVKDGILNEGLGDLFSYKDAGIHMTGAARCQSYSNIPIPRMSNIRIQIKNPIPLPKEFLKVTPADLQSIALKHKWFDENGREILYLSGFSGGQVSIKDGDFMFNCACIYCITPQDIQLYKPAIISGKTLEALKSIRSGIGKKMIDSAGTCGKMGQGVPSSGGSNMFLFLEQNPHVLIGGES